MPYSIYEVKHAQRSSLAFLIISLLALLFIWAISAPVKAQEAPAPVLTQEVTATHWAFVGFAILANTSSSSTAKLIPTAEHVEIGFKSEQSCKNFITAMKAPSTVETAGMFFLDFTDGYETSGVKALWNTSGYMGYLGKCIKK